jgi:ABC-type branched-subunit amino acid transport system substrate-binding protein
MTEALRIGVLFSTSGPYAPMGRDARDGAEFALAEFATTTGRTVAPVFFDPRADLSAYLEGARELRATAAAISSAPSPRRAQGSHSPCRKT